MFLSFQWDILLLETGFVADLSRAVRCAVEILRRSASAATGDLARVVAVVSADVRVGRRQADLEQRARRPRRHCRSPTPGNRSPRSTSTTGRSRCRSGRAGTRRKFPQWFQKLSVVFVFVVELVLPWFIFGPRLLRYVACGGITLADAAHLGDGQLQLLQSADDRAGPHAARRQRLAAILATANHGDRLAVARLADALASRFCSCRSPLLAIVLGIAAGQGSGLRREPSPGHRSKSELNITQFCLVNDYGLFRQHDRDAPRDRDRRQRRRHRTGSRTNSAGSRATSREPPRFNTPHQPRLDWQMWFEALRLEQVYNATGTIDPRYMSPWFQSFLMRLLAGEPTVVALLADKSLSRRAAEIHSHRALPIPLHRCRRKAARPATGGTATRCGSARRWSLGR